MEEFLKNILTAWGFPHLIEIFIEEEIDQEAFENLEYTTVKDIIQKAGPRQKFWNKYREEFKERCESPPSSCQLSSVSSYTLSTASSSKDPTLTNLNFSDSTLATNIEEIIFGENATANRIANYLKTAHGEIVKAHYNKFKKLENKQRNLLANVIIQKEFETFNTEFKIKTERFQQISQEIVQIFPTENSGTYYIPYNNKTKCLASGKLWECFNRLKRNLKASTKHSETIVSEAASTDTNEKFSYLKASLDPLDKIERYWADTSEYRLKLLKIGNISIQMYMSTYKILGAQKGIELLARDFDYLYPELGDKLFLNWPEINLRIIRLAKQKKVINSALQLILDIDSECSGFFILPYLICKSVYKKGVGKRIKLSGEEIAKAFILHIQDANLVREELEKEREKAKKNKSTLQPIIVVAGASLASITAIYIAIDSHLYNVSSLSNAIDYCFKSFFALHAGYPDKANAVWTFIQRKIYEIETDYDRITVAVSSLLADL